MDTLKVLLLLDFVVNSYRIPVQIYVYMRFCENLELWPQWLLDPQSFRSMSKDTQTVLPRNSFSNNIKLSWQLQNSILGLFFSMDKKLCTHFSFLYCQCVLVTSWKWLQGASCVLSTNFTVQLSHLIYSSFFWFVPRWSTLLNEIKFPWSFKIKFFKSGYKPPFFTSNLLPSVPQLLFELFVSFHWQTGYRKAQARPMRFGAQQ